MYHITQRCVVYGVIDAHLHGIPRVMPVERVACFVGLFARAAIDIGASHGVLSVVVRVVAVQVLVCQLLKMMMNFIRH